MKSAKRIISVCLTATLVFQAFAPSTSALAEEVDAVSTFAATASNDSADVVTGNDAGGASSEGEAPGANGAADGNTGAADTPAADEGSDGGNAADGAKPSDGQESAADAQAPANNETSEPAAAQQDAAAVANSQITTIEELRTALGTHGSVEASGETARKITFKDPEALCIISNADPAIYQTANIEPEGITGGALDLTSNTFQGFGNDAYPFGGGFDIGNITLQIKRSFYNNVELSDGNKDVKLTWKGTSNDPIVAKKVKGNSLQLSAVISLADTGGDNPQVSDAAITSALVGAVTGDLSITASYSFVGTRRGIGIASNGDNAGLLVNTLSNGASLTIVGVSGLEDADNAQAIKAANGNAGGLIGAAGDNSTVNVSTSVDVSKLTVTASDGAAGGFIGSASKLKLSFSEGSTIHPALNVGDSTTNYAGGAIGNVSFGENFTVSPTMFVFGENGDSTVELGVKRRAGGLFGLLDLASGDVAVEGGTYKSKLVAAGDSSGSRGGYGGIAGDVCSGNGANIYALTVAKNGDEKTAVEINKAANIFYTGGIVGYLGGNLHDEPKNKVACVLDGAEITCSGNAIAHDGNAKYGGAVGVVDTNQVLDVRDFKVKTSDGTVIGKDTSSGNPDNYKDPAGGAAGIVGSAWRGIIKFSGTTDLSEAKFGNNDKTAQLLYQNYNALVFATGSGSDGGWTYLRPNDAVAIDDIYDYGQVVRLGNGLSRDLIKVNESTHALELATSLAKTGGAYVINSADDFAKLAITWQTFGYFSMVNGVSNSGFRSLLNSSIQINGNISLAGTGLTGLAKDRTPGSGSEYKQESGDGVAETDSAFAGALSGSGAINLAVGEPYGKRGDAALGADDTSYGNGKIYRHGRLGLFNELGGAAISGSVTISGTMKFDGENDVDAGALAAVCKGGGATSISGLTVSTAITYDNTNESKTENIGGIFGQVTGDGSIGFSSGVNASPTIVSRVQDQGYVRVAGAIAYIAKESSVAVNAAGIAIGGSISVPDYKKDTLVGGFIAYIRQDEASLNANETKRINIAGLSFIDFSMEVNAVNSSNKTSGGLLGYSWGNAIVEITGTSGKYALATSNASVAANSVGGFGGLLYAASGNWKINDYAIDLSGAKLSASNAEQFGVLICRAGSSADNNSKIGVDALTGLYLKNTAPWTTAYKVNEASDAISTKAETFDEWVADATRPYSQIDDIAANGVVSLHTEDEKLNMSGSAAERNSYVNRTSYGMQHKTNASARYYYNLDRAVTNAAYSDTWITNAEGLLLWSAWRYAPVAVQRYVTEGLDSGNSTMQDALKVNGSIDLTGYSYYPVDNYGASAELHGSLTFSYKQIAQTEQGNKKNNERSQHANMHLSLFRSFNSSNEDNKTLTAGSDTGGFTLKGTIGKDVINEGFGSGALVSSSVNGSASASKIATISVGGLSLGGLTVWTEDGDLDKGGASPLVVNALPSYATLAVNKLGVEEGSYPANTKAATSLFGSLGGENADMVSASFSNISVPSLKSDSIFTHASFLESFGYRQGGTASANYIFYKNDPVTYGNEIDANGGDNEYVGKQLWYYDDSTYGSSEGLVTDGTHTASEAAPEFGGYLPYVNKGKDGTSFHEIKVNQRVPSLVMGCGTYGDPYVIKTASQINTVAAYINNEASAVDDWEIAIAKDQGALCTRRSDSSADNEVTYVYRAGKWIQKYSTETIDGDTMHRYLQSAYYSIEPEGSVDANIDSIELDTSEFAGFGNKANPFRGVIVGNLKQRDGASVNTGIVVNNKSGHSIQGLIPYSYGSVVKDLSVTYSGSPNEIAYVSKDVNDGTPNSFFGGVFGCILGGDNIIDDVTVSRGGSFAISPTGSQSYLVPIGGYVGAIAGGGVIFRDMSGNSWINFQDNVNSKTKLYANSYIGRVIDGYAFSEGCTVNNGNKNYKVNELTNKGTACVETGEATRKYKGETDSAITTTVKNAQGLLVLSAIISSGAGGGSSYSNHAEDGYGSFNGSRAYAGRTTAASGLYLFGNDNLGKVRNADYSHIGVPDSAAADFEISTKDDRLAPGSQTWGGALDRTDSTEVNSPYLVKYYATWQTGNVCAPKASGMDLQFAEGTYDMSSYGTGFTGLSGRYYSNACASSYGADRDRIVPQVACINGNGAKIALKGDVEQYLDDDYILQSWGGLFSAVEFTNSSVLDSLTANGGYVVKDLQFGTDAGDMRSSVSLTCIKSDGSEASYTELQSADKLDRELVNWSYYVPHMGVGMLAGSTANREALDAESGKYKNVKLVNCDVESASMSGGLYGNSGWAKRRTDSDKDRMIDFSTQRSPVRLYDCSYSNVAVTGASRVGGFVGAIGGDRSVSGAWATADDMKMGENSTIASTAQGGIIGGAFGLSWSAIRVNVDEKNSPIENRKQLVFNNVTICNQGGFKDSDLDGTGGFVGNPKEDCAIASVKVDSSNDTTSDNATYIGRNDDKTNLKRVGGLVGQIEQANKLYSFTDVTVHNIKLGGMDSCGGIVGYIRKGPVLLSCDGVTVDGVYIDGTWSGGIVGAIGSSSADRDVVSVSNSVVENVDFAKKNCGGISGDGRGEFRLTNVLFDQNAFSKASQQGLILGDMVGAGDMWQFAGIHASGIDVIPAKKADGKNADLPKIIYANNQLINAANQKSYIAFSDYNDALTAVDGSTLYSDERSEDGSELVVESASPYVATNPVNSQVKVKAAESSSQKSIFGDGAAIDTAETIKDEAGKAAGGRYAYTNIGGRAEDGSYQNTNAYSAQTSRSTFNDNNVKQDSKQVTNNFPVLLVSGNDSTTVTNYLNLVTNGGFSDAVRLNAGGEFVTAKAEQFVLSEDKTQFVRSDEAPSLTVVNNGTPNMSFRASSKWDNEESRFTLLTVTFNNGSGHTYKVQVPIIVKRMLEIDFTATYMQGTDFKSSDYNDNTLGHVLIGFGDTMTSYLSWTYNQAKGKPTEYGWNSHLESGGAMRSTGKVIKFSGTENRGTLPEGTQLTLVDPSNNGKEYHYTVSAGGASSVALSDFMDSAGANYQEKWLSEIMEVKTEEDNSGIWVKLEQGEGVDNAGVKIGSDYYRVAKEGDSDKQHYKLSVENEEPVTENFYLTVRVPEGSKAGNINGYTGTSVTQEVNTNVNYLQRALDKDGHVMEDGHVNTPSTYSVDSNYEQTIIDNKNTSGTDVTQMKELEGSTYSLGLDVSDQVKLGENQYNSDDTLYYRIDSSLEQFNNGASVGAVGYPAGASGTVSFFVTVGGRYYTWDGQKWNDAGTEPAAVVSKPWEADGKDMSLVLSDLKDKAISLAGIRAIAKDVGSFEIQMKAELSFTAVAGQAVIMASQNGESFTKPTYRCYLSPNEGTLSTSSMMASHGGAMRYYLKDSGTSTIALVSTKKTQLGINVNDLSSADGNIALVGTYDFSKLTGADSKLEKGDTITYTLTLQRRNDGGGYDNVEGDIGRYISIKESNLGSGSVSGGSIDFTDHKSESGFVTREGSSLACKFKFTVKVNTDVEGNNFTYSNYRLVLTASLSGGGQSDTPNNVDGAPDGYQHSDYVTYELTKVNTKGIDHQ